MCWSRSGDKVLLLLCCSAVAIVTRAQTTARAAAARRRLDCDDDVRLLDAAQAGGDEVSAESYSDHARLEL